MLPPVLPPRYVLYTKALPAALSLLTKASPVPPLTGWNGASVGKSLELVNPETYALPPLSTATA